MLTQNDLSTLREALACWARLSLGCDLTRENADFDQGDESQGIHEIHTLYDKLSAASLRYIVEDCKSHQAINTRLFRRAPHLRTPTDRYQIRTVIG